jgi:hypothetical protein
MQFDPSKYRISESAEFEVLDAEGNVIFLDPETRETPWTITVASPGTKKARAAFLERQRALEGDVVNRFKGKKSTQDEDSAGKLRADFLMKIVEGTNAEGLTYNGKTGLDALREIFLDPYMAHVAVGLENFHDNRGNFTKG